MDMYTRNLAYLYFNALPSARKKTPEIVHSEISDWYSLVLSVIALFMIPFIWASSEQLTSDEGSNWEVNILTLWLTIADFVFLITNRLYLLNI